MISKYFHDQKLNYYLVVCSRSNLIELCYFLADREHLSMCFDCNMWKSDFSDMYIYMGMVPQAQGRMHTYQLNPYSTQVITVI